MGRSTNLKQVSRCCGLLLMLGTALLITVSSVTARAAQTYENSPGERKVISRVNPDYPVALKQLYIGGVVRVEVVVAASGNVRSLKLLGGVEQCLNFGFFAVASHCQLADQEIASALQHLLLAEGKRLGLMKGDQALQYSRHFQQRSGAHAVGIFFEAVFPVAAAIGVGNRE